MKPLKKEQIEDYQYIPDTRDSAYYELTIVDDLQTINSHKSNIKIVADPFNNISIQGFTWGAEFMPYDGKVFVITNALAYEVELQQQFFRDAQQYLPPGMSASFIYDNNGGSPIFRAITTLSKNKKDNPITVVPINGITHTVSDLNRHLVFTNVNPVTVTVPTNATDPIPVGTEIIYTQQGDGVVTLVGAGITFVTNVGLSTVKGETRTLRKIGVDTWSVEGDKVDKDVSFGTIFLSSTGNDSTAEYGNSLKPYLTLNAALTAYASISEAIRIQIISGSNFATTSQMAFSKILNIFSDYPCTITVNTSLSNIFSGCPAVNIDIKNGTIVFSPTTDNTGNFASVPISINANTITFNSTWSGSGNQNSGTINLNSRILNVNTARSILDCTGGTRVLSIKSNTINMRNAGASLAKAFVYLELDFDNLTHDNTFSLHGSNSFSSAIINHGNISSVAPYTNGTNVTYISSSSLSIVYKNACSISSNLTISRFNTAGTCYIVGICSIPNSIGYIRGNSQGVIVFNKTYIESTNLIVSSNQMTARVYFIDSNIRLSGNIFISYLETGAGATYLLPTAIFRGNNTVIVGTDGAFITQKETTFTSTNEPQWDIRDGVLITNGLVNDNVTFLKRNLNQYNSTTIIP